ncbi:MAG TPA: valine--tRNA ligase [Clostridiales bacterium]|nr:valine--tRNA ligase [Clostridiales bacterium]
MELASKYDPQAVESKWYQYWLDNKLFSSKPDGREPYTVVIPPPNVTGVLHMGHMLNNTIQDILVRRARMEGKNACWVPGTDHASIATEAKVVNKLAQQGIKKTDLTREEFLKHAWAWTEEHGGIILKQLRKLGASCDWDRTAFTMDDIRSKSVIKVFCDLYNKGLIYRGVRMVNWDPKAQTALSDEEVIYKDEHSKLYYLKYRVVESDVKKVSDGNIMHKDEKGYYAVVATTRPETIMGDTAMCINPNDEKNTWLKGKHVVVPLVGREIPVIEDDYVDIEFGTGCLKVTPAHDINDHALGLKHNLETIDIFNDNGTISEAAGMYVGMDRMDVRKQIEQDLKAAGLMEKVEDYNNKVGFSERTNVPIEPKLSTQWFLSMKHFADIALPPVMDDDIQFYPSKYKNTYRHWLENIKDWCISRQLWWGHRIPAYYFTTADGKRDFVVAENIDEALKAAQEKNANLSAADLEQDSDCLDTWFSSWLWPISLFNGILDPDNEEIKYYYPTCDLVTGPDIIFFWVARMIFSGIENMGEVPFSEVLIHGLVRDSQGRKMSKSLGNGIDPLEIIDKYGADTLRFSLATGIAPGSDTRYSEEKVESCRNFMNKLWNASRFLIMNMEGKELKDISEIKKLPVDKWILTKLQGLIKEVTINLNKYEIGLAAGKIYDFVWSDFCDWYIEMEKPLLYGDNEKLKIHALSMLSYVLETVLKLLHPFVPFVTEEIFQILHPDKALIVEEWPKYNKRLTYYAEAKAFEGVMNLIKAVRNIRAEMNVAPSKRVTLLIKDNEHRPFFEKTAMFIEKLAGASHVEFVKEKPTDVKVSTAVSDSVEVYIPLGELVDTEKEIARLTKELENTEKEILRAEGMLGNQKFVANAPKALVEKERDKLEKYRQKRDKLSEQIENLK